MTRTILVPVDGSDYARRALAFAATEFREANLVVLHVVDPFDASPTEEAIWNREFVERREREAEALLEEYEALATDHGVSIQTELVHGSPARAILGAVDDFDIDHIVVGSRGRTGAGRVLLGSVAETVAKRAPVSVTIVRPERE
ncbi:universal stress protein [Halobacteria archaeon AArc-m2/3/4]|uniref:Universal stress protein n=1 Tax=Natronoglomus mannanivorans TaxID=2979990 RepID=A0AAP3E3I1_9EURY|nr:universal stress protein [Halobacteria archaeon AArc-xg1-1]MCU4975800.1 universal stress protein [Halobacteria archaeon AArc-m2/3/4]